MQKPNGYAEAKIQGEYEKVELGGHNLIIKQVSEKKNRNGGDMIVVLFDFDTSDKQGGYFMDQFNKDERSDKKWPNQATEYINVYGSDGMCTSKFKTFCTCVEHSNAGAQCFNAKGEFQFAAMKNKKIGGVFGEQLDYYNGQEKNKRVLRWFVSLDKVAEASIPGTSYTSAWNEWRNGGGGQTPAPGSAGFDAFMNVDDSLGDELPFN